MAIVSKPQALFKVTLTEHERGWGQKPWEPIYFDNEEEARQYARDYNAKHNSEDTVPDWYVRADYAGPVR